MTALAAALRRRETVLAALLLALLGAIGLRAPAFVTPQSLQAVLTDGSILVMMAVGQMLVILTRGIDLSVASNLALTGMAVGMLSMAHPELPAVAYVATALVLGLVLGSVNGVLVAAVRIPPIVVTLGTLSIYRGLTFVLSGGEWISSHELPAAFVDFPRERLLGLTYLVWLATFVALAGWVFLKHGRVGREIYALGGNPNAARYVGIPAPRRQFLVYALSGTIAGLCGYLWVARYAIAYTEVAVGFELQVIAACVIGGVSIAGGVGTVAGAVLGALFLTLLYNALPMINVSPFWQMAIAGATILVAVVINSRGERRRGKLILPEAYARARQGARP